MDDIACDDSSDGFPSAIFSIDEQMTGLIDIDRGSGEFLTPGQHNTNYRTDRSAYGPVIDQGTIPVLRKPGSKVSQQNRQKFASFGVRARFDKPRRGMFMRQLPRLVVDIDPDTDDHGIALDLHQDSRHLAAIAVQDIVGPLDAQFQICEFPGGIEHSERRHEGNTTRCRNVADDGARPQASSRIADPRATVSPAPSRLLTSDETGSASSTVSYGCGSVGVGRFGRVRVVRRRPRA